MFWIDFKPIQTIDHNVWCFALQFCFHNVECEISFMPFWGSAIFFYKFFHPLPPSPPSPLPTRSIVPFLIRTCVMAFKSSETLHDFVKVKHAIAVHFGTYINWCWMLGTARTLLNIFDRGWDPEKKLRIFSPNSNIDVQIKEKECTTTICWCESVDEQVIASSLITHFVSIITTCCHYQLHYNHCLIVVGVCNSFCHYLHYWFLLSILLSILLRNLMSTCTSTNEHA